MQKENDPRTGESTTWLNVDEFAVVRRGEVAKTILGSCVGVVLFDVKAGLFALNHYLLPKSGAKICSGMLAEFVRAGATSIKAHIYGGAVSLDVVGKVGELNVEFARQFLKENKIPILKENIGGKGGRRISVRLGERDIAVEHTVQDALDPKGNNKDLSDAIKQAHDGVLKLFKKSK